MNRDRYVVLGLGRSRSSWFRALALWTTSGAVPAEFQKCLSAAHARQRLAALQPQSVLLIEDGIAEADRDLIEAARREDTPTIVISDTSDPDQWLELGAVAVLPRDLTPEQLRQALVTHAKVIGSNVIDDLQSDLEQPNELHGRLIVVCGPGGTGASTIAMATAQAAATNIVDVDHVLLADLARNNELGMLHDAPDVVPGIEEVVEMHRSGRASADRIRDATFAVDVRGYRLLQGQRHIGSWTAMPPAATRSAIAALRRTFRTVVADITADFEGTAEGGSVDVEERNALARIAIAHADLVFVVGSSGIKGVHAITRVIRQVAGQGVEIDRIIPIVNQGGKRSTERAEISRAITTLLDKGSPSFRCHAPIFVPKRPLEDAFRFNARIDKRVVDILRATLDHHTAALPPQPIEILESAERVRPGSLGSISGGSSGR